MVNMFCVGLVYLWSVFRTPVVEHYGWEGLAELIPLNCFKTDPSEKSSLKFLRKTQWARDKVETLYINTFP